jgi:hypothetical protein
LEYKNSLRREHMEPAKAAESAARQVIRVLREVAERVNEFPSVGSLSRAEQMPQPEMGEAFTEDFLRETLGAYV